MLTRYWDRRGFIRVPATGPIRWASNGKQGHCELSDISPGGAGLRMPIRKAMQLGARITLEVDLSPSETWQLADDARVVRQVPDEDGTARVGVEFLPEQRATFGTGRIRHRPSSP